MEKQGLSKKDVNHLIFQKSIVAGLVGGVIGSIIWLIMYYFHFTKIRPFIIWEKLFSSPSFFDHWYLYLIGVILNGVLSILLAVVYFLTLKQFHHWLIGLLYGIILWLLMYLLFPFLLFDYNPFHNPSIDAHTGFFCIMIIYGVFIGYTISFDHESLHREYENNN